MVAVQRATALRTECVLVHVDGGRVLPSFVLEVTQGQGGVTLRTGMCSCTNSNTLQE